MVLFGRLCGCKKAQQSVSEQETSSSYESSSGSSSSSSSSGSSVGAHPLSAKQVGIEIDSSDSDSLSSGGCPALSADLWNQVLYIDQKETAFTPRNYTDKYPRVNKQHSKEVVRRPRTEPDLSIWDTLWNEVFMVESESPSPKRTPSPKRAPLPFPVPQRSRPVPQTSKSLPGSPPTRKITPPTPSPSPEFDKNHAREHVTRTPNISATKSTSREKSVEKESKQNEEGRTSPRPNSARKNSVGRSSTGRSSLGKDFSLEEWAKQEEIKRKARLAQAAAQAQRDRLKAPLGRGTPSQNTNRGKFAKSFTSPAPTSPEATSFWERTSTPPVWKRTSTPPTWHTNANSNGNSNPKPSSNASESGFSNRTFTPPTWNRDVEMDIELAAKILGLHGQLLTKLSKEDVKRAFRKKALKCHPDRQDVQKELGTDEATKRFQELRTASDTILELVGGMQRR